MTVFKDTVITEFLIKNTGMAQELGKFSQAGAQLAKLKGQGVDVSRMVNQLEGDLGKGSLAFKTLQKSMKQTYQQGEQMKKLGPMFAFLFGGMAMQRLGMGIVRFVLPAMDKLQGYTSEGTKKVNAMNASFQFLKFSMFEAVTSSKLFETFVEWVIKGANWMSKFASEHPTIVAMAAALGGIVATLGTLAIGAGLFNQFAMMASYLGIGKSVAGAPSIVGGIGLLDKALIGLGAGITIAGIFQGWEAFKVSDLTSGDFWKYLANAAALTASGLVLLGAGSFALPVTLTLVLTLLWGASIKTIGDATVKDAIARKYAGVTKEALDSAQSLSYQDEAISQAFIQGQQGTVVPDFVTNSWTGLDNLINDTAISSANAINTNLVDSALPQLDSGFIKVSNTAQTELIDKWENWTPSPKTLKIKVEKSGDKDYFGSGFGSNQYTGSVTGE